MTDHDPLSLFDWLPLLAMASGRKMMPGPRAGIALFIALSGKGATGKDCSIDEQRLTLELGISTRQVWRHVEALVDDGWIERTQKPTRATKGRPGRRARYRLTDPSVNLADESLGIVCHDDAGERQTNHPSDRLPGGLVTVSDDSPADPVEKPNRLTFPTESSDIATPELGTVSPVHPSTTRGTTAVTTGAAAARDQLAAARRRRQGGAR